MIGGLGIAASGETKMCSEKTEEIKGDDRRYCAGGNFAECLVGPTVLVIAWVGGFVACMMLFRVGLFAVLY